VSGEFIGVGRCRRVSSRGPGERDPFPPVAQEDSAGLRAANRAVGASAVGAALTGLVELAVAILGGAAGLLGGALRSLSDVSTFPRGRSCENACRRPVAWPDA
jgi:hypothetical protein